MLKTSQSADFPQISLAISLFLHYCIYAAIYILQIFTPLKLVSFYKPTHTTKPLLGNLKKDLDEPIEPQPKQIEPEDDSFTGLFVKLFHQNTFFYTMCCIIGIIAYPGFSVIIFCYIGLLCNIGQAIGLYLSNEFICKVAYCGSIVINFLILIFCISNY